MSFDLHILIQTTEFPESEFLLLLSDLGETDERDADKTSRHWRTIIDESAIFCSVRELVADNCLGYERGYKWQIRVSANSGCSPRARWAQFAVVFRSTVLIPNSSAYDPQSNVLFDDPEAFVDFSQVTFPRWPKLVRQLRRLELVTPEGQPRF